MADGAELPRCLHGVHPTTARWVVGSTGGAIGKAQEQNRRDAVAIRCGSESERRMRGTHG